MNSCQFSGNTKGLGLFEVHLLYFIAISIKMLMRRSRTSFNCGKFSVVCTIPPFVCRISALFVESRVYLQNIGFVCRIPDLFAEKQNLFAANPFPRKRYAR
jgi:hypothetical protein